MNPSGLTETSEALISMPELCSQQRRRTPKNIAIHSEDGTWTYGELDEAANRFAAKLHTAGTCHGSHVGLCVDRSAEAIAAMLGIMKTGAAFVPLDPEYPVDRLGYMVEDATIRVVIGHSHYRHLFEGNDVIWLDCETHLESAPTEFATAEIAPSDLAYIMYTSGSTGKPKGVQIQHSAFAAYCFADIECYELTEDDRTLQFSTLCFDIAIEEIFPPLLTGGAVVIRPRDRANDSNELSSIIRRFGVTAVHLATAYWHSWVDLMVASDDPIPESIRLMIATGEKVSVEHYRRWQKLCQQEVLWCNAYGPTETTVTATVFIPDHTFDAPNMPIGKPLRRYTAYILDDKGNSVEQGETGHLFIGGPALALGYLNRPELTEAAFVEMSIDGKSMRLYRTGDLARWLPDGNIDFAGRVDHQIKLGSYRIEPGEIEAILDQAPCVQSSLVTFDEVDNKKFLVAYVARGQQTITAKELSEFLRGSLPNYMIPTRYVFLESFPKTINGKIDRKALPAASEGLAATDDNYVPARNDLERRLVELWQIVLNVPEIGVHDDFFLLGGSSLLVTQVVARLTAEMDIELPVRDFFANPTIATLATHLQRLLGQATPSTYDADVRALRDRLPLVEASFFPSDGHNLYAIHYRPRQNIRNQAVVMCHAVGHEYTRGYRNLQQLAVHLCSLGYDVLRFDYAGTGNSQGDCGDLTVESIRRNILDAKCFIAKQSETDHVSAIGLRLGATVLTTLPDLTFEKTVAWDPVFDGSTMLGMFDQFHDQQLAGMTRFNVSRRASEIDQSYGHRMTSVKRQSLSSLHIGDLCEACSLVVTEGSFASFEESQWLAEQRSVRQVSDSIYWDDEQYTESAFSSPESFAAIVALLSKDSV
ncbi:Tyrocidine synthase 3 [Planctomycetes bacterium CA13]|uniref:Tyrocidine synthase 3 n=1 Tax=Novipirellula herctigrandis TaxID=2527986 RepID=A0A5C5Z9K9_9BACT|nr:Tyrocidine synthase 3 [Planctomycetes bacterium CA13]